MPDILDHKQAFSVLLSNYQLKTGPFDNRTQIFHSNSGLLQYSDGILYVINYFRSHIFKSKYQALPEVDP